MPRRRERSELDNAGPLGVMLSERRGLPGTPGEFIGLCVWGVADFTRRILRWVLGKKKKN
jgi:hypothetical protein